MYKKKKKKNRIVKYSARNRFHKLGRFKSCNNSDLQGPGSNVGIEEYCRPQYRRIWNKSISEHIQASRQTRGTKYPTALITILRKQRHWVQLRRWHFSHYLRRKQHLVRANMDWPLTDTLTKANEFSMRTLILTVCLLMRCENTT